MPFKDIFIACVSATLLVVASAQHNTITEENWRDPKIPRSLDIIGAPTQVVAEGSTLEMICSADGLMETTTLTWMRADGAILNNLWTRGRSNLTLSLTVTRELNGAEFFCFAPFTEDDPRPMFAYFVYSQRIKLKVQGAPAPSFVTNERFVVMSSDAPSTTHRPGDIVNYTCQTFNLTSVFLTVILAKGEYETQIHVGVQPVRSRTLQLRKEDHGASIYCSVSTTLPGTRDNIQIVSNSLPINIQDIDEYSINYDIKGSHT